MKATLTQRRTGLEIQPNGGEITHNKQLNKSKREASKPGTHKRTGFNTTCLHQQNRIQDMVDGVTLSKPAVGKDPPKKDPTSIKTQRHTQSQYKRQPKTSKFRGSRRLHYWISQVFYHRSSHHKPRESDQFKKQRLTGRVSQTMGRQKNNPQMKGKEEASERMLNEIEASQLSDTEFKAVVIKKLKKFTEWECVWSRGCYVGLPRLKVKIGCPCPGKFRNNNISLQIRQFPFAKRKNVHFLLQLSAEQSSSALPASCPGHSRRISVFDQWNMKIRETPSSVLCTWLLTISVCAQRSSWNSWLSWRQGRIVSSSHTSSARHRSFVFMRSRDNVVASLQEL